MYLWTCMYGVHISSECFRDVCTCTGVWLHILYVLYACMFNCTYSTYSCMYVHIHMYRFLMMRVWQVKEIWERSCRIWRLVSACIVPLHTCTYILTITCVHTPFCTHNLIQTMYGHVHFVNNMCAYKRGSRVDLCHGKIMWDGISCWSEVLVTSVIYS